MKFVAILFIYRFGHEFFGGGNDSNYYHAYAVYEKDVAVNLWPNILRFLNDIGLYDRKLISSFLIIIDLFFIPYMCAKMSICDGYESRQSVFFFVFLVVSLYPSLFYYSFDIYRDVFMVFIFVLCLCFVRYVISLRCLSRKMILFFLIFFIGYVLFLLRPYLGVAIILSLFFYRFIRILANKHLFALSVFFLVVLNIFYSAGALDPIMQYRQIFFDSATGGANLGVSFSSSNIFILDFIKSAAYQLFGLYFPNLPSVVVFFVESVPFIFCSYYVIKNLEHADSFVWFLLVFTVLYSSVFILGNDNLGTAVRLRIYSYISVFISSIVIFQRKNTLLPDDVRQIRL